MDPFLEASRIALLLACAKKVLRIDRALRSEGWGAARELRLPMGSTHDETLGVVGLGRIGREAARSAHCSLLAHVLRCLIGEQLLPGLRETLVMVAVSSLR